MTNFKIYIPSLSPAILLVTGGVCLNLHGLTHINNQTLIFHQADSESVPVNKISDACVLCLANSFNGAGLMPQTHNPV
ncbi:MAG: hypothetical protein RI575_18745, partial [Balneolaceae bacterium]|nr:hypothetical protein [Balneolaceae bacterium]